MENRQPHAVLELSSRRLKALKIERLLGLEAENNRPLRLLEIGTGSGGIAHYFATHSSKRFDVYAVDTVDQRLTYSSFKFSKVADTNLPFDDDYFDVVISNHVIEHVGCTANQLHHLSEIRRVLRREGKGYFAVPNRWMLIEPHYKLAFLSWLPKNLRSFYLRLRGRGSHYDCNPLSLKEAESLLAECGFAFHSLFPQAIKALNEIEHTKTPSLMLARLLPTKVVAKLDSVNPTLIFLLKK